MSDEAFARLTDAIEKAIAESNGSRSLASISVEAGLGRNFLQQTIKRRKMPKFDSLSRICSVIGCRPTFILSGETLTPEDEDTLRRMRSLPKEKQKLLLGLLDALDQDE